MFENLLDFLLTERKVCEYLESDLRNTSTRLTTHSVVCEYPERENVKDALHEIKLVQDQQNIMMSECLSTVSKLVSWLSGDARNNRNVKMWCWYHDLEGHIIHDCYAFKNLNNADKFACLKHNRVCFRCVSVGHLARYCKHSGPACDIRVNGKKCKIDHHRMLHHVLSATNVTSNLASRDGYLLMVSSLEYCQKKINVL